MSERLSDEQVAQLAGEHGGWASQSLAREVQATRPVLDQMLRMAHATALFKGGMGDGDPIVGFLEWIDLQNEEVERLDRLLLALTGGPCPTCGTHGCGLCENGWRPGVIERLEATNRKLAQETRGQDVMDDAVILNCNIDLAAVIAALKEAVGE